MTVNAGWCVCQFGRVRPDEELADKEGVPGVLGDDADGQSVGRVSAAEKVLNKQVASAHVFEDPIKQGLKPYRREGLVHFSPVDQGVGHFIVDCELVFGAAAGARCRVCHQGAVCSQAAFSAHQRALNELRNWHVYMHLRSSG